MNLTDEDPEIEGLIRIAKVAITLRNDLDLPNALCLAHKMCLDAPCLVHAQWSQCHFGLKCTVWSLLWGVMPQAPAPGQVPVRTATRAAIALESLVLTGEFEPWN